MDWDTNNPLAPTPDEPARASRALNDYALLGAGRTLAQLAEGYRTRPRSGPEKPPTRQLSQLKVWSTQWGWVARVAAYDAQIAEQARRAWEARWVERQAQLREQSWDAGQAAIARALELLQQTAVHSSRSEVVTYEPDEDGRRRKVVTVTIERAPKGSLRDIAALLKAGGEAARLATGDPTSHQRVDIRVPTDEELAAMSEAELAAYEEQIRAAMGER